MKDMINEVIETTEVNKKSNKKVILISIISIVTIIVIGLVVTYFILSNNDKVKENEYKKSLESKLSLQDKEVEYGSEETFEVQDNVKVYKDTNEIKTFKFNEVGTIKFIESIKGTYKNLFNQDKEIEVSRNVVYTIKDTKAPIIEGVEDKTIVEGTDINLREGIKVYDEVDGDLEFEVIGEVDKNTVGEYTVSIKAVDKNNNETTKEYTVRVEEKIQVNNTTSSNTNNKSNNKNSNNSSNNTTSSNTNNTNNNDFSVTGIRNGDQSKREYFNDGYNYYYDGGGFSYEGELPEGFEISIPINNAE